MPSYKVTWEIDIQADSPQEAAEDALRIQRNEDSEAVAFVVVQAATGEEFHVDLLEREDEQ